MKLENATALRDYEQQAHSSSVRLMTQEEFLHRIRLSPDNILARRFLDARAVHLFADEALYQAFRDKVGAIFPGTEIVAVVGSGNWRYSLNPEKVFREFGDHSDVDVAVISSVQFHNLWEEMRRNHRHHYYTLSHEKKTRLRRNSENVYAGFISPDWIPNRNPKRIYEHKQILNTLSDQTVRFLKVKLMFFKNADEAVDYYARGFRAARRAIQ